MQNGKSFETARDSGFRIRDRDLKTIRDAKYPENEALRPITKAFEIQGSGQNFPGPTFFKEQFYN